MTPTDGIISDTAYAKINLALHVRARRADGYHQLETVFAFVDAGDMLTAKSAHMLSLSVCGPFADYIGDDADNLVLKTAKLLQRTFGVTKGAELQLTKNLPIASGIGGGSADAAATARLLNRLWDLGATPDELASILSPLGADIPACIASISVGAAGIGTELAPLTYGGSGQPILLVNPGQPLATSSVFMAWDGVDRGALPTGTALEIAQAGRNDLEIPACVLCPAICDVMTALSQTDAVLHRMSGSGATCFGLYDSDNLRDTAARHIAAHDPNWWIMTGHLR